VPCLKTRKTASSRWRAGTKKPPTRLTDSDTEAEDDDVIKRKLAETDESSEDFDEDEEEEEEEEEYDSSEEEEKDTVLQIYSRKEYEEMGWAHFEWF
jgi:hypothetical protein